MNELELILNRGYNPYRDKVGRFATGPKKVPGGGLRKGKSSDVSSVSNFKNSLKQRGIVNVEISNLSEANDIIANRGIGKTILQTIDNYPPVMKRMINSGGKDVSLRITDYPRVDRKNRRYTRGSYNKESNRITLYYDTKRPRRTSAKRMRQTLIHELAHSADFSTGFMRNKNTDNRRYYDAYLNVSRASLKTRSGYITSVKHHVKNAGEFYADTMTTFIMGKPLAVRATPYKKSVLPIVKEHLGI